MCTYQVAIINKAHLVAVAAAREGIKEILSSRDMETWTYQVAIIYETHLIAVAPVRKGADGDLVPQVGVIRVLRLGLELTACKGQEQQGEVKWRW